MKLSATRVSVCIALVVTACGDDDSANTSQAAATQTATESGAATSSATNGTDSQTTGGSTGEPAVPPEWDCAVSAPIDPPTISFKADIAPIFAAQCNACHHVNTPAVIDLTQPFDLEVGPICRENSWVNAQAPILLIPGDPDASALVHKVERDDLDPGSEGGPMALSLAVVTAQEIADLRQWVTDGAQDDAFFASNIANIFGDGVSLGASSGKCGYCHYPGGNITPDLTNPFDPVTGVVGIDANLPGMLVAPGDPDASVLIQKVDPALKANVGTMMPPQYEPLSPESVQRIRTWIAEGAWDN